jgi:hypothetical protein
LKWRAPTLIQPLPSSEGATELSRVEARLDLMRQDRLVLVDVQQNVVEGEMFGFPVPGEWPGGRDHTTEPARAEDTEDPAAQDGWYVASAASSSAGAIPADAAPARARHCLCATTRRSNDAFMPCWREGTPR